MFTGIVHDLTLRRRLEREIVEASGNEQRRIGQDLHDGLCQQLAGVGFGVENLAKHLEARSPADAAAARKLGEYVKEAITQARQLARGLNPVNLDRLGLAASLKDLSDKISETTGINCKMTSSGDLPNIGGNTATHLYRIAQESVNNATRHGKAKRIVLQLAANEASLTLSVTDNGIGFPTENAIESGGGTDSPAASQLASGGMGLHSMSYRARLMGGTFSVGPGKRGGTVVVCTVPFKADAAGLP
jgi:signal transduction histidine kinase